MGDKKDDKQIHNFPNSPKSLVSTPERARSHSPPPRRGFFWKNPRIKSKDANLSSENSDDLLMGSGVTASLPEEDEEDSPKGKDKEKDKKNSKGANSKKEKNLRRRSSAGGKLEAASVHGSNSHGVTKNVKIDPKTRDKDDEKIKQKDRSMANGGLGIGALVPGIPSVVEFLNSSKEAFSSFHSFLEQEFAAESLDFYSDVKVFKEACLAKYPFLVHDENKRSKPLHLQHLEKDAAVVRQPVSTPSASTNSAAVTPASTPSSSSSSSSSAATTPSSSSSSSSSHAHSASADLTVHHHPTTSTTTSTGSASYGFADNSQSDPDLGSGSNLAFNGILPQELDTEGLEFVFALARPVYMKFIHKDAEREINIPAEAYTELHSIFNPPAATDHATQIRELGKAGNGIAVFNRALRYVIDLMQSDPYMRYRSSEEFKNYEASSKMNGIEREKSMTIITQRRLKQAQSRADLGLDAAHQTKKDRAAMRELAQWFRRAAQLQAQGKIKEKSSSRLSHSAAQVAPTHLPPAARESALGTAGAPEVTRETLLTSQSAAAKEQESETLDWTTFKTFSQFPMFLYRRLFHIMDVEKTGKIGLLPFVHWMHLLTSEPEPHNKRQKISLLFKLFDMKNRSRISRVDASDVMWDAYHSSFAVIFIDQDEKDTRKKRLKFDADELKRAKQAADTALVQKMEKLRIQEEAIVKKDVDELFKSMAAKDLYMYENDFVKMFNLPRPPPIIIWWMDALVSHGAYTKARYVANVLKESGVF